MAWAGSPGADLDQDGHDPLGLDASGDDDVGPVEDRGGTRFPHLPHHELHPESKPSPLIDSFVETAIEVTRRDLALVPGAESLVSP